MDSASLKQLLLAFRSAAATFTGEGVQASLSALITPDSTIRMCHPFGDLEGPEAFYGHCFSPLLAAMPDLERRDMIVLAGDAPDGERWIGCMGNYMGTFAAPFLGIPPTGHLAHMRYHEFFRVSDGRVAEVQAIWDIPELMMLAGAWPMAPQLGAYLCTPGPMPCDGLKVLGDGSKALAHVTEMLADLCRHPAEGGPEVMRLEKYWHPRFNWYGPAGIGAARGIAGFRNWHQIPFLRAMPDRKLDAMADLTSHWVAEGDYVCETGWPNMSLTITGDGWLGIAPANQKITMRSLDFWRCENGLIRENWVLVDLLNVYHQIGVDVLDRAREFIKARRCGLVGTGEAMVA